MTTHTNPEQAYSLSERTRVGRTALRVANLEDLTEFYGKVVGLSVLRTSNSISVLGADDTPLLVLEESEHTVGRHQSSAGLFHNAFRVPSRKALGDALARIRDHWQLGGASDHWQLSTDTATGFVELQEAAGFEDNGRFNYHLKQLLGSFIRQIEAGYELTHAGKSIVRLIQSGNLGTKPSYGPTTVEEGRCPYCGNSVALYYRDDHVLVLCDDCAQSSEELGSGIPPE